MPQPGSPLSVAPARLELPAAASSALRTADLMDYSKWNRRRDELAALAGPVLASRAVQRLGSITFLGILSPRFTKLLPAPVAVDTRFGMHGDGSRLSHSMGVALLCVDVARSFGFTVETQRYAAVWGLLHDLGNWPLAHTGEHAFRRLTGCTTRALRRQLITGEGIPPSLLEYVVRPQLEALGIDLARLLALMEYRFAELPPELRAISEVMKSPLSPDAFEGMWRCGRAIGTNTVDPEHLAAALQRDPDGTIRVRAGLEELVLSFWRSKMCIYETFLNRPEIIQLESAWAHAIERELSGLTLDESLQLSEETVISRALAGGLPPDAPFGRHKPPIRYGLAMPSSCPLPAGATMAQVASMLVAKPLHA